MKKITLWVAVAGLAFAGVAKADTFDFSYTFSDGGVVNGALQGTLDGNFVDNVSNVTMSYISADQTVNITEPTPIYIYQEETVSNAITWVSGAVVSFDPTQNNFDFTTQPVPPFSSVNTDCFFMLPTGNTLEDSGPGNPYAEYYLNGSIGGDGGEGDEDDPIITSNWTLNDVSQVPEPSTWAMLAMGGAGLMIFANRRRVKA